MDLNGNLVGAGVEKEANDETMVRIISNLGKPSLIATDVAKIPGFVSKVGARFNVRVFSPQKSLTTDEKRLIGEGIMNPHIRDAYAAAIKAYRKYANRLRQIDSMETVEDRIKLKHMVIQGIQIGNLGKAKQKIDNAKKGSKIRKRKDGKKKREKTKKQNVKSR